jgi:hypothetical protein
MRKMVQSSRWLLQFILFCIFFQLGSPCFGKPEHSSVGVHKERKTEASIGNLYMFVLYVIASEYGKRLDKQAKCPIYCGINHKHKYEEKESNIQGNDGLLRPDKPKDREQSEGSIRPIASTD